MRIKQSIVAVTVTFGHTTEDCWALKDKIKELVQAGHLHRFVLSSREDMKSRVN